MGVNDRAGINDEISLDLPCSGVLSGFCQEYGIKYSLY